jgi:hypothetical protein
MKGVHELLDCGRVNVPHPESLSRSVSWKGAVSPGEGGSDGCMEFGNAL